MRPVLVVLGSREPHERRSRAAAAVRYLAQHPEVTTVVFSGHNGEAEEMLAIAQGLRLRSDVEVFLEQQSRHTHDNAMCTRALLESRGLSECIPVVLSCRYHMPRAVRTFQTVFPRVDQAIDGAWTQEEVTRFMRDELPRIVEHGAKGHVRLGPFTIVAKLVHRLTRTRRAAA